MLLSNTNQLDISCYGGYGNTIVSAPISKKITKTQNKKIESIKKTLRTKIISHLEMQGFDLNNPDKALSKDEYKSLQQNATVEERKSHIKSILEHNKLAFQYLKSSSDIDPKKIELELIEVKSGSKEEKIYKWWNFIWWNLPYQRAYGRQMRFVIWDKYHDAPFGLIGLQSPILKMADRDRYLGIPNDELDVWINKSMSAQRLGALPPYNDLIGGKMVAMALISNEIRNAYKQKYNATSTLIKGRHIEPELLFTTTTSAFGRSSIYNRVKIDQHKILNKIGNTKGYGSFHISESLYLEILEFLALNNIDVSRSFGTGPSKRIKLLSKAFQMLGVQQLSSHGLEREIYIIENVSNLSDVIRNRQKPIYYDYSFENIVTYWKSRWAIPRSERQYGNFSKDILVAKVNELCHFNK